MATETNPAAATREIMVDAAKHGAVPGTVLALLGFMLNSQISDIRTEVLARLDRTEDRVNEMGRELAKVAERSATYDRSLSTVEVRLGNLESYIMGGFPQRGSSSAPPYFPTPAAPRYEGRASPPGGSPDAAGRTPP